MASLNGATRCEVCGRADVEVVPVGVMIRGVLVWSGRACLRDADDALDAFKDRLREIHERQGAGAVSVRR